MTFRTPDEAVALANNTRFGLAASVWSENINRGLEVAARLKAGVIWINATNLFDAAAGFGGYRESGFGREGGREGLYEYLTDRQSAKAKGRAAPPRSRSPAAPFADRRRLPPWAQSDRTAELFIGGKQARPDTGYSHAVLRKQVAGQSATATARTSAMPSKRRYGGGVGRGHRAHPRAESLLHWRKPVDSRGRVRGGGWR